MELLTENLGKRYGDLWAIRNVSLTCGPGLLGLVGPNGAGKTTFLRMVATLLPPTEGRVSWNGHDAQTQGEAVRQVLGYLPQEFGLYPEFSARQFLRYMAAMKGLPRNLARSRSDEMIEVVNLERVADRKLKTYSGGMKQRVGIAQALLNDPELLIVDEPTAGLDPEERVRFRTLLANLTVNRLVILSTHIISDVEAVAGRLLILHEGSILSDTTPDSLLKNAMGHVWSVTTDASNAMYLQNLYQVCAVVTHRNETTLRLLSSTRPHGDATIVEPTLEDAYLLVVGTKATAKHTPYSSGRD
jgi:ABC-2 type transport system ATP-binding protein